MVTITLTPELERVVVERAQRQGTTPELWTLDKLRETLQSDISEPAPDAAVVEGETMADFFVGYAGTINSREIVPGGANMSQDTGRKFKELMLQKRREGKL